MYDEEKGESMSDVLKFDPRDAVKTPQDLSGKSMNLGSLYDMNRYFYEKMDSMKESKRRELMVAVGLWFSSKPNQRYFMFLCKELSDYTIFHFDSYNYSAAKEELDSLVSSRGELKDIQYNHDTDTYDFWVQSVQDNSIHMYKLFACNDFIIEV